MGVRQALVRRLDDRRWQPDAQSRFVRSGAIRFADEDAFDAFLADLARIGHETGVLSEPLAIRVRPGTTQPFVAQGHPGARGADVARRGIGATPLVVEAKSSGADEGTGQIHVSISLHRPGADRRPEVSLSATARNENLWPEVERILEQYTVGWKRPKDAIIPQLSGTERNRRQHERFLNRQAAVVGFVGGVLSGVIVNVLANLVSG